MIACLLAFYDRFLLTVLACECRPSLQRQSDPSFLHVSPLQAYNPSSYPSLYPKRTRRSLMGCGASAAKPPANDAPPNSTPSAPVAVAPPVAEQPPPTAAEVPAKEEPPPPAEPPPQACDQPTGGARTPAIASEHDDLEEESLPEALPIGSSTSTAEAEAPFKPAYPVFFVLGAPGSGKTVVCTALADRFGCTVLSVSDLMRSAIQDGGTQGTAIKNMISSGQVVPTKHTLDLVVDAMRTRKGPYLIDGFPKSVDTLETFVQRIGPCAAALVLEASEELLMERLLERGRTSGRTDDNRETIGRRFRTYNQHALHVVDLLHAQGLVTRLDAALSAQQVYTAASEAFETSVGSS